MTNWAIGFRSQNDMDAALSHNCMSAFQSEQLCSTNRKQIPTYDQRLDVIRHRFQTEMLTEAAVVRLLCDAACDELRENPNLSPARTAELEQTVRLLSSE